MLTENERKLLVADIMNTFEEFLFDRNCTLTNPEENKHNKTIYGSDYSDLAEAVDFAVRTHSVMHEHNRQADALPEKTDLTVAEPTGDVQRIVCDNCSEELLFWMKDNDHTFAVGLCDLLECLIFASDIGSIPEIPSDYLLSLKRRFTDL